MVKASPKLPVEYIYYYNIANVSTLTSSGDVAHQLQQERGNKVLGAEMRCCAFLLARSDEEDFSSLFWCIKCCLAVGRHRSSPHISLSARSTYVTLNVVTSLSYSSFRR